MWFCEVYIFFIFPNSFTILILSSQPGVETFIVWAQGSISNVGNPLFHNIGYARQDGKSVSLDFGRAPQDNCSPLCTIDGTPAPTMVPPPPFHRPFIGDTDDTTVFDCHIGPSGGPRGYAAITEEASWGIAWYCNDLLIPKLTLRRGTTYTFRINGGDNQADDANYHPFYLTTNPVGGYLQQTPKERLKETPLLGINILEDSPEDGVTSFEPTLVAPICRYEKTQATTEEVELGDFEDYFETLDTSCADDSNIVDNAAVATFTPDETTPDTIYYHCVTHYNLGFEIEVLDSDDPKITPAPTAVPIDTDGFKSTDLPGDLDGASLLYKVNYEDERASGQDTASFILVAPTTSWVGFAFSTTGLMLGSEAVIGTPETGEVLKYSLNAQSVSGVVPMSAGKQTLIEARITQDGSVTTLEFTKILVEEGEIPIGDEGENTFLGAWGFGNALNAPHQKRGPFIIDLAGSGEAVEGGGVDTSSLWKAHGFLLALAWGGATPLAIGASLIRKLLPGNTLWFQIHMAFNILSVTLTIIGVIIAIVAINKQTPDGSKAGHFDPSVDKHRLIGLIVFIFAVIQAIGGLARPRLPPSNDKPDDEEEQAPSAEKSKARKAWEIGHRLFGVGLLGLCWAQVHLGIERYNLINGLSPDSMLAAFWSIVGIIAGFSLLGKGYSMTKKED